MNEQECPFCKLVSNMSYERDMLKIVYESDNVLAFHATKPYAEVHIIIISKKHIPTIFDLSDSDSQLKLEILSAIRIASEEIINQKGACKVEMYLGSFQQVQHLHCHVIYDSNIE
ncbi:HIT domain-containing protein [Ruminiclostridium herbifermentans]|uniref:HIT domain-containing protein n=1 Tax=Ruminiclostridium herbifermentans TaxID=2488810 RepID=A0A4U7JKA4_9FIRM|nr:HIT domain-containing protein [Ruminiclostridium herbifermentans]QNU66687.1 HIT domain-containing protein [Ruminiclostridium herbifermentans]